MARSKRPPGPETEPKKKAAPASLTKRTTPPPTSRRRAVDSHDEIDEGWGQPPASLRADTRRGAAVSHPPIEVDPSWVSLHTLAPPSVRHPTHHPPPVRKGPPPLPPPMTIPVESGWLDEEHHEDPDAAARAAFVRPKGAKPPPIPRAKK